MHRKKFAFFPPITKCKMAQRRQAARCMRLHRAREHPRILSAGCWPCNLFGIMSAKYPRWPSPVTWLPGNRNGVPVSFTSAPKVHICVPTVAGNVNWGRRGKKDEFGKKKEKKKRKREIATIYQVKETEQSGWWVRSGVGGWTWVALR